ncbi:phage holin, lambda family, partial [Salmonella enterica]|nr:phage holin, lambda family [Salmonella enterica]EHM9008089.1 phage holin family protein [Salmonella enterica]
MNNDPHSWTDWWVMVKSWINGDIPLDSLLMTAVIATLRVLYTGRSWRRLLLEV